LEGDFDEVFRWFILIDLKRLEGEVRGLRDGDQMYRVENIENIVTPYKEICYTADVIATPQY